MISNYISSIGTLLTGIAAVILAYWAINKYFKERSDKTKLSIEISNTNYLINGLHQVYIDVLLKNEGIVAVHTFKRFRKNDKGESGEVEYTWKDSIETIKYSVELQLKKVKQNKISYNWFSSDQYEPIFEHINLITDYENPDETNSNPFFIDPGETYHFGSWFQLERGLYEAKVIVVGDENELPDDFWMRRFPIEIK